MTKAISVRHQRHRFATLVCGLVTCVLVAACSDGTNAPTAATDTPAASQTNVTSPAGASNSATSPTAVPINTPAATQASATNPTSVPTNTPAAPATSPTGTTGPAARPGTEEFGLSRQGLVQNIESVESLISKCMRDAGFEYIAADYNTVRRGMLADKSLPGLNERQYIAQFGFGISTLYTGRAPQLADATTPAKIGLGEQNVRIFNNLSPADQVAYNRTLFGDNTDATLAVGLELEDFSRTGGCTRAAIQQVFTPDQLQATYHNPLDTLIEQDPRMVAALTQYADCVRAAGFNYNHPNDVERDLKNRLYAITSSAPVEALSADAKTALTQLQGEERAVSVASFDCEVTILDPVEGRIERELFAAPIQ